MSVVAWAGLIVQGDADLIPFPGGRTSGRDLFLILMVMAGVLLAAGIWRARRRTS